MIINVNNYFIIKNQFNIYYIGNNFIYYNGRYCDYYIYYKKIFIKLYIDSKKYSVGLYSADYNINAEIRKEKYPDFYNYIIENEHRFKQSFYNKK